MLGNTGLYGGGIYNVGVGSTLNLGGNSTVSGNTGLADGGGIYSLGGTVNLNGDSRITNNTASSLGGGVYNGGTLIGAINGIGGNVHDNTPDDIYPIL